MKRIFNPTKPRKVLIIEDDAAVADIYQRKFQSERYDVDLASDGEMALYKLAEQSFDLVILDLSLPGMNGVEVLKTLRNQPRGETLPVIVLTNAYAPGLMQAASAEGATRCIKRAECTPGQMMGIVHDVFAAGQPAGDSTPPPATASAEFEKEFQSKLVADFLGDTPYKILKLRNGHHAFVNGSTENLRLIELRAMYRQARLLAGAAGVAGFGKIAQLAAALEALLFQICTKPAKISPSVTRTLAQALDLLAFLFDRASLSERESPDTPAILVVDDEIVSREATCAALEKANVCVTSVEDPIAAEDLAARSHFDLIFLDVEMPGRSGLDLCAKIRKMATNCATPVVFITAHSDFESRAQSRLSGGNDFIAKPFLSVELAVKALTWLFKEKTHLLPTTDRTHAEEGLQAAHNQTQSHPALVIR